MLQHAKNTNDAVLSYIFVIFLRIYKIVQTKRLHLYD